METEDDMIVVIVGDGENEGLSEPVKEETLNDDEVEKLIESAATHGQLVDGFIKEEVEEYEELEEFDGDSNQWEGDCEEEYVPESDDYDEDDDYIEGSANEAHNTQRHRMLKPSQQRSFVKELRDKYPELKKDSNALVTMVSEIMRNVKPSPPPRDYFIMNGIMFECVFCGTLSETQASARRHYHERHGDRYLICFACGVDFRSTTNLYKHEKRCSAADAGVVLRARARALGRKGRSRPYMPVIHDPVKRKYGCNECPAAFVSKTYLRSHELLHRGLRPYRCDLCVCAYTSHAGLSRHRKTHDACSYVCDSCGRGFKVKTALVAHMNTHLPVKKFGCSHCGKRYATKAALGRHVARLHLGLPPPCVCKICHKRYPLMSMLKQHTKKAHGLLLMTRRMFFKSLPMLTDTQIEQAKVVLKSEMEPDTLQPLDDYLTRNSNESDVELVDEPQTDNNNEVKIEPEEPLEQDLISADHSIVLSEEALNYMQSLQRGNYNVMVVKDGQLLNLNYDKIPHALLSNGQLVLQNGNIR